MTSRYRDCVTFIGAWASAGEGKRGHRPPPWAAKIVCFFPFLKKIVCFCPSPGKFCLPLEKSLRTPLKINHNKKEISG